MPVSLLIGRADEKMFDRKKEDWVRSLWRIWTVVDIMNKKKN